ncbi:RNA 2',3'-cyclic phosphodiesterase [Nocardioides sp. CER19]|uniref:RNA 2',3'-cyclic phosphodiesterase n=1 Tax=Nocardioides sp. CER19 TaxID=3038538 RepID=UPI00244AF7DF|nr:RNA 2',3'-cyclic phosphodiesterase [Nocardioides sp. CER19]MDH2413097.1 RNA 2',3'-cyclic phosphodiesterase [Nocardioides sp. CER19]
MRLFAALIPPERALEDLDDFLDVRREAGSFRWTQADQIHVTLAFLADAPERSLDELVERLGRAAARRTAFPTAIAGGGAFPDAGRAKVLWAGLDLDDAGRTELARLATGARAAGTKSGIEVAGQRFKAHVTVARLGRPQEVTKWVRLLDAYRGPTWTADTISLVQSHLGEGPRNRPRYEVLEEFALGAAAY